MSYSPGSPVFTQALVAAERCARNGMPLTAETLASEDPNLPIYVGVELLADERFAAALEELGINHSPTQRITSAQMAAAQIYLAAPAKTSHTQRLRAIGITQAKWNGWMRQPEFQRYIAAGSADFYNPEGGYPEETPYVNSPALLRKTIEAVYRKGSALEYEVDRVE